MWSSLITFVSISTIQNAGYAISFSLDSNFQSSIVGATAIERPGGIEELQLAQRGLNQSDAELIPKIDSLKILNFMKAFPPEGASLTSTVFNAIRKNIPNTLMSQILGFINYLMTSYSNSVRDRIVGEIPISYSFTKQLSKEDVLVDVEKLPRQGVADSKPYLDLLAKVFQPTDLGPLFASIRELFVLQPALLQYGSMGKNLDKLFGLDKPLDFMSLGLPVPNNKKPVVYFQLIDEKHPKVKCVVRVKKDKNTVQMIILILPKGFVGEDDNADWYTYEQPYTREGVADLYKKLPISKFIKFIKSD